MRRLKILGSGDAFANGGRFTTSFCIIDGDRSCLIDCGASTLIRLKQEKIPLSSIDTIFITHFHGDHYGGLPFIIIAMKFERQGSEPITVVGPPGVKEQVRSLQEAMYPGTGELIDSLPLEFVEYSLQKQDVNGIGFVARTVTHAPPSKPHGLELWIDNQKLAYSGDTEWDDNLLKLAADAKIFIIECNNLLNESAGHLSHNILRARKDDFKAEKIYLTHLGVDMLSFEDSPFEKLQDGMVIDLW